MDSCRIWESHGGPADIEDSGQSLKHRQRILPRPSPAISNSESGVGGLGSATNNPPRRVDHNTADRELLIRTVLKVVRERRGTDRNDERDRGQCFSSVAITRLTQVGVIVWLGNDRKMTLMDPDGPRMCMTSQFWGVLHRRKRTAVIVQFRVVQRWWIRIQNWTLPVAQRGVGAIGLFWGAC